MEKDFAAGVGIFITLVVGGILTYNLAVRKYDVLSWRNIFLAGFMFFHGLGAYFAVTKNVGQQWYVPPADAYPTLAISTLLFMAFFLVTNHFGGKLTFAGRLIPKLEMPPTSTMLFVSIATLCLASVAAAVIVPENYLSGFFTVFKSGFGAAACGLALHWMLSNIRNPAAWAIFGAVFAVSVVAATVGETGRRNVLSVFMALPWMWYYHSQRYRGFSSVAIKFAAAAAALFVLVGIYSNLRGAGGWSFSERATQFANVLKTRNVEVDQTESLFYTDTSNNTLFILATYPERYPYIPGNGPGLFFGMPIPRSLWTEKPVGLGLQLKYQMDQPANLGPGIIGHGWAEGGYLGVAGYAIFFGLLTGALDLLIRQRAHNPYFVAALGASLGNVLGLARGETSIFLALCVAGFVGTWMILSAIKISLGRVLGALGQPVPELGAAFFAQPAADELPADWHDDAAKDAVEHDISERYADYSDDDALRPTTSRSPTA